jgi:tetratricopeptide (TPR) repeat protein
VLERLGAAYLDAGQPRSAITSFSRGAQRYQQAGDPLGVVSAAGQLATALLEIGDSDAAVTELERALTLAEQHDDDGRQEASIRAQFGAALIELGRSDEAETHLAIALHIYESHDPALADEMRDLLEKLTLSR